MRHDSPRTPPGMARQLCRFRIVHLNVKSLWGYAPADHLLYSNDIERSNTGRVATKWLRRYRHIERGGWHCSGIEPDNGNEMEWGCFKPDFPRCNEEGQPIKYEHPPKSATRAFFLRVPLRIWQKIAERYSVAMQRISLSERRAKL